MSEVHCLPGNTSHDWKRTGNTKRCRDCDKAVSTYNRHGVGRFMPQLFERDGRFCHYCGIDEENLANLRAKYGFKHRFNVDHLVPRVRGGGDNLENLVVSCADCNNRKGTMTPEDFKKVVIKWW